MNTFDRPGPGVQKALVTGATSGLCRASRWPWPGDSFEVIVHGRDVGRCAKAVEGIDRAGGTARFAAADLSDPAGTSPTMSSVPATRAHRSRLAKSQ